MTDFLLLLFFGTVALCCEVYLRGSRSPITRDQQAGGRSEGDGASATPPAAPAWALNTCEELVYHTALDAADALHDLDRPPNLPSDEAAVARAMLGEVIRFRIGGHHA